MKDQSYTKSITTRCCLSIAGDFVKSDTFCVLIYVHCKFTNNYKNTWLNTSKHNDNIFRLQKQMDLTFQQICVGDNQTLHNKHSCTGSERMNLLKKKKKRAIKNWNTYERLFMCYQTDTESEDIPITNFSITRCTEQDVRPITPPSSRVQTRPKPSDFSDVKILSMPSFGGKVK
jgi:hypothetical protein